MINFFTSAALAGAGQFQKLLITNLNKMSNSITVRNEVQVKVISIFNILQKDTYINHKKYFCVVKLAATFKLIHK